MMSKSSVGCMEYSIRRSGRARFMRLTIYPGGTVVVTAPMELATSSIEGFVKQKMQWILKKVHILKNFQYVRPSSRNEYIQYRLQAQSALGERIEYWNQQFRFSYKRISIKNHRTMWGSCSRRGNINLNYRLLFLPVELQDYVVVHELCHLREHNHSSQFWNLVASVLPEYRRLRKELKQYSSREIPT